MHANTEATWSVPAGATAFEAVLGLPDELNRYWTSRVVFEVKDERGGVLCRSAIVANAARPLAIAVPLHGARTLTLSLQHAGAPDPKDHGVWASAAFVFSPR
jgi:hypothetical protein